MAKTPDPPSPRPDGRRFGAPRGGRPAKRSAITNAARTVFGREGYARTSIDAIATEAGVSKRTIYNHFTGKDQLFAELVADSSTQVADRFLADVDRGFTGKDSHDDLEALGHAFVAQGTVFPEHWALVAKIRGEERHFPIEVIESWQEAGPRRVRAEVARRLEELTVAGLLHVEDRDQAARHFTALVAAGVPADTTRPPNPEQLHDSVVGGVAAFLDGYRGRSPASVRTNDEVA